MLCQITYKNDQFFSISWNFNISTYPTSLTHCIDIHSFHSQCEKQRKTTGMKLLTLASALPTQVCTCDRRNSCYLFKQNADRTHTDNDIIPIQQMKCLCVSLFIFIISGV